MNNLSVLKDQGPTMTSREIAEVVESRHDKVKQSIERLVTRGVIGSPQAVEYQISGSPIGGAVGMEYLICKRDSYIIVAQLSPEFTARLVDRWQELEAAQKVPTLGLPDFTDPVIAARAWADAKESERYLQIELTAAAPAIEFVAKYADSTGLKGFRQVCKLLGANESDFREFLLDKKIMYRLGGEWMPHAAHLDTGRFMVKAGTSEVSGHAFNSAKFTPKGVSWVAGEYAKYKLEIA